MASSVHGISARMGIDENSVVDGIAVAYVTRMVAAAGLLWRNLGGQDIGLDGAIDTGDHGHILVQVKGTRDSFENSRSIHFDRSKDNHLYWLNQGLPVLICLVRCATSRNDGREGIWITYRDAQKALTRVSETECRFDRKKLSALGSRAYVRTYSARCGPSLGQWLRSIILTPRAAVRSRLLTDLEETLEQGRAREAKAKIETIADVKALPEDLTARLAKAFRRLGLWKEVNTVVAANKKGSSWLRSLLTYEQAFSQMTRAFAAGRADRRLWERIRALFEESAGLVPTPESALIGSSCAVYSAALQRALDGEFTPLRGDEELLARRLAAWTPAIAGDMQTYTRRYINAQLALCRLGVALQRPTVAGQLADVVSWYMRPETYHSALWLAHLTIVKTWHLKSLGDAAYSEWRHYVDLTTAGLDEDAEIRALKERLL